MKINYGSKIENIALKMNQVCQHMKEESKSETNSDSIEISDISRLLNKLKNSLQNKSEREEDFLILEDIEIMIDQNKIREAISRMFQLLH